MAEQAERMQRSAALYAQCFPQSQESGKQMQGAVMFSVTCKLTQLCTHILSACDKRCDSNKKHAKACVKCATEVGCEIL